MPCRRLLIIIFGLTQFQLLAQRQIPRFGVGPFAGYNKTNYVDQPYSLPQPGWNAGALGMIRVNDWLSAQGQLGITHNRSSVTEEDMVIDWKRYWAEGSALVNYYPFRRGRVEGFAGVGFTARYILSSVGSGLIERDDGPFEPTIDYSSWDKSEMYQWNFSMPVQFGSTFTFNSGQQITLLLEYQAPIRDLYKPDADSYPVRSLGESVRVNSFGAKLGYVLPIEREEAKVSEPSRVARIRFGVYGIAESVQMKFEEAPYGSASAGGKGWGGGFTAFMDVSDRVTTTAT